MKPIRIQRKRAKGWRMSENTVYVGRGSKWGNPYHVMETQKDCFNVVYMTSDLEYLVAWAIPKEMATRLAIKKFREGIIDVTQVKKELQGKNLMCWCGLDQPCHGDILLELANPNNSNR